MTAHEDVNQKPTDSRGPSIRTVVIEHDCDRCGHSPRWHRFDDDRLPEFTDVPWDERPFRCLGPDLAGCGKRCPDFTGEDAEFVEVSE